MKAGKDYIGVGCGALIVNDNDETLLLLRSQNCKNEAGYWSKPGGSVEFGEKIEEAIKREISEELNINIELLEYLCYTDHIIKEEGQHWVAVSYLAKITDGEPKIAEPEKHEEIQWFSPDNVPKKLAGTTKDSIRQYKKKKK